MKTEVILNKASFGNSLNPILVFYTFRRGEARGAPARDDYILLVNKKLFEKNKVPASITVTLQWDDTVQS